MEHKKSITAALILLFVGGIFGLHRFYLGFHRTGIFMLLTGGGFVWMLILDLFRIGDLVFKANGGSIHHHWL